jgi:ABC-type uncharacterized transport system auxiliary subunit
MRHGLIDMHGAGSRPRLKRAPRAPALVLCGLLLAGCAGLIDNQRPAEARYWLEPLGATPRAVDEAIEVEWQLTVVPGLDTDRILALETDARLRQLEHAHWADHLPDVLQSVLGRSLRANGLIPVERGADCRLSLEVQSFFLARGAGSVEVVLAGHVRCMDPAEAVVAQAVAARAAVAARGESVPQVVAAFQQALDEATTQLLEQAGEIIAAP